MSEAGTRPKVVVPAAVVEQEPVTQMRPEAATAPLLVAAAKAQIPREAEKEAATAATAATVPAPIHPAAVGGGQDSTSVWRQVVDRAGGRAVRLLLNKVTLESLADGVATLTVPAASAEMLAASVEDIQTSLGSITGVRYVVQVRETAESPAETPRTAQPAAMNMDDNPLVKQAAELFGARVVSVQARKPAGIPAARPAPEPESRPTMEHTGEE